MAKVWTYRARQSVLRRFETVAKENALAGSMHPEDAIRTRLKYARVREELAEALRISG